MSDSYEDLLGPVIGVGSSATIYAKDGIVTKLFNEYYPKANIFAEAFVIAMLEPSGVRTPKVHELYKIGNRYALKMDQVRGQPLQDVIREHGDDPNAIKRIIDDIVTLQVRYQKETNVAEWAPRMKPKFRAAIEANDRLDERTKSDLLNRLAQLPDGDAFCHCDFHPGNLILDDNTLTIIDMVSLCTGDAAGDAAASFVDYCMASKDLAKYYALKYCEEAGVPIANIVRWLPIVAGLRVGIFSDEYVNAEQINPEYPAMLQQFIVAPERVTAWLKDPA